MSTSLAYTVCSRGLVDTSSEYETGPGVGEQLMPASFPEGDRVDLAEGHCADLIFFTMVWQEMALVFTCTTGKACADVLPARSVPIQTLSPVTVTGAAIIDESG